MTKVLYGIRTCDTVRKARAWLDAAGASYAFHDYKTAGVPAPALRVWIARLGWEALLNRAGTTFRNLPEADKQVPDTDRAIALSSLIRRPVLTDDETLLVGFKPAAYEAAFSR